MSTSTPPSSLIQPPFRIHSRTDVGKRRKRNEDSLGAIARHGIFIVADGMGGVDGGDYSSRKVVEMMTAAFERISPHDLSYDEKLDLIEATLNAASTKIKCEADLRGIQGMGTTAVVLCFDVPDCQQACILHVGDSRVYRYRNHDLNALTVDHSMAAESGLSDSALVPVFMAGVITRAVGVRADVEVDRTPVDVRRGDLFVLCSDGLYNMVRRPQFCSILQHKPLDPAAELVNAANDAGGFDNITVVLVELLTGSEGTRPSQLADTTV